MTYSLMRHAGRYHIRLDRNTPLAFCGAHPTRSNKWLVVFEEASRPRARICSRCDELAQQLREAAHA